MYLLDTNIINHIRNGNQEVIQRLRPVFQTAYVSGIVVEEILNQGYLAEINNIRGGRSKGDLQRTYEGMFQAIRDLSGFNLVAYTPSAEQIFKTFRAAKLKGMDGRIAAHALELGYILVTENLRDFEQVPGLTIENWLE